jgi:hypothetical protein
VASDRNGLTLNSRLDKLKQDLRTNVPTFDVYFEKTWMGHTNPPPTWCACGRPADVPLCDVLIEAEHNRIETAMGELQTSSARSPVQLATWFYDDSCNNMRVFNDDTLRSVRLQSYQRSREEWVRRAVDNERVALAGGAGTRTARATAASVVPDVPPQQQPAADPVPQSQDADDAALMLASLTDLNDAAAAACSSSSAAAPAPAAAASSSVRSVNLDVDQTDVAVNVPDPDAPPVPRPVPDDVPKAWKLSVDDRLIVQRISLAYDKNKKSKDHVRRDERICLYCNSAGSAKVNKVCSYRLHLECCAKFCLGYCTVTSHQQKKSHEFERFV